MTKSGVHSGPQERTSIPTETEAGPVITNGPALWSLVLARMPVGAIVAGGAVRDYLLGVEPKDIDVFCPTEGLGGFDFTGFEPLGEDRREEYEALSFIDLVQRTRMHGFQIDLVGVYMPGWTPRALVETFDFGITRCWFDGEALHDTAEAGYDRSCDAVTLLVPGRPERAAARFARFNEAHGGRFTFVDDATTTPTAGYERQRMNNNPAGDGS